MTSGQPEALARRLGTLDATVIGVGSMIGAGVFAAFAPAAAAAGSGLVLGLLIAAGVAYANATSSASLAAQYPRAGGTYLYGRERLGPWPGFLAGWGFVVGKTASCAAMALTFAAYVVPSAGQRLVAVAVVLGLAAVNYRGVTRTAQLTRVLVVGVLLAIICAVVVAWARGTPDSARISVVALVSGASEAGIYGVLQAAGLLFFALAGYARIATLGEEVRDPARTIPRAISLALAITVAVYAGLAATLVAVLGPAGIAATAAPVVAMVETTGQGWAVVVVRAGAAIAALGALLALLTGIGRTSLAMAREQDLPPWLSAVHARYRVPHRAEVVLAVVVSALVLTIDLRGAIGFSSFGVLVYYLIANLSALTQARPHRRYPRFLPAVGAVGCATLVVTLPGQSVVAGVAVLSLGVGYRWVRLRWQQD